jgi:tryptophan-rich sensory protein
MTTYQWYKELIKPSWAPPSWIFGPVWSVLYVIIFITFGFVLYKALTHKISWFIALPFILNLIFNFAFTPIQFGLKNNFLAMIDILLVLLTLIWALVSIFKIHPEFSWIVYLNIPYFLWVLFATVLQITITYLNR